MCLTECDRETSKEKDGPSPISATENKKKSVVFRPSPDLLISVNFANFVKEKSDLLLDFITTLSQLYKLYGTE